MELQNVTRTLFLDLLGAEGALNCCTCGDAITAERTRLLH